MTAWTTHAGFPNIILTAGMVIKLEAIDPTTGNPVAGVTSSRWSIYGEDIDTTKLTDEVPYYTPTSAGSV